MVEHTDSPGDSLSDEYARGLVELWEQDIDKNARLRTYHINKIKWLIERLPLSWVLMVSGLCWMVFKGKRFDEIKGNLNDYLGEYRIDLD